ncbi:MAG: transcriptional regulator [marine bacterium B5-7]|nr:MAG: transcriptional regulator [marine bacterium B5-7]
MSDLPKISEAEWLVMEIVWSRHPVSGAQVAAELSDNPGWHPRTVKTMLGRLAHKGAIGYTKDRNTHHYSPLISRQRYLDHHSKSLIQRLFGGDASEALSHFVEVADLDSDDIEELKDLLDNKKNRDSNR